MGEGRVLLEPPADWSPAWLTSEVSRQIISALGKENVRFVGGAVRDSLLGQTACDIDMATIHSPEKVCELLREKGIKAIGTGMQHGTVTAVWKGHSCEITTLRRDMETDGRHAKVAFTDDWQEDAKRRDFTINALYATADRQIFDPFDGLEDLKHNRVRFIGDAETRIREDALRIYRFFRFSARFGTQLDAEGLAACRARSADVSGLSRERVRDELLKLLSVSDPRPYVKQMAAIGILPTIEGSLPSLVCFNGHVAKELNVGGKTRSVTKLSALYADCSVDAIAHYFRLSNKQGDFMRSVRAVLQVLTEKAPIGYLLYRYGTPALREALAVYSGDNRSILVEEAGNWDHPGFPVSGKDLLARGFVSGEALGKALEVLEQRWIDSGFKLSRKELLQDMPLPPP